MTVRDDAATWSHVNVDGGAWPIAERDGLEIDASGALVLGRLPSLADVSSGAVAPVPGLTGPAGIGIDPCGGDIFVADPGNNRIVRIDPCDGAMQPLWCTGGPGTGLGALNEPRGVIVGPRRALYVADSGNARIQVFDIATGQRIGVWGQQSLFDDPAPSDEPGRFNTPWDLAVDAAGLIYVADPGIAAADGTWTRGRVQRFNADGEVDLAFGQAVATSPSAPGSPVGIAIVRYPGESGSDGVGDAERLLVLDQQPARLLVFRRDGQVDAEATLFGPGLLAPLRRRSPSPPGVDSSSSPTRQGDCSSSIVRASSSAPGAATPHWPGSPSIARDDSSPDRAPVAQCSADSGCHRVPSVVPHSSDRSPTRSIARAAPPSGSGCISTSTRCPMARTCASIPSPVAALMVWPAISRPPR